ncbi:MAG TPA: PA14 domain-containing protein [Polyangiaceae bacterium]|nr:PA14 domain-containing protein [Polyangiaceae bacterium]
MAVCGLFLAFGVTSCGNGGPGYANANNNGGPRGDGSTSESCATPQSGCACDKEGESTDCGQVYRKTADYVSCSMGKMTCSHGAWGACVGDRIATMNVNTGASSMLRALGLGSSTACVGNPCDPYCVNYVDTPLGVDGGNTIVLRDGGLSTVKGTRLPSQTTCTALTASPTPQTITVTSASPLVTNPSMLQFITQLTPMGCVRTNVPATWADSNTDMSAIDSNGNFVVYAPVAAKVNLTAYVATWQASAVANVVVNINDTSRAPSGTTPVFSQTPSGSDSITFLYPYANTVFPRGLASPLLQWDNGGTAAAAVKVSLRYPTTGTPTFTWSEIIPESNPPRATLPQAVWAGLDQTAKGQDALIVIQRDVGGMLLNEQTRLIHFSSTPLRGQIYYTEYDRTASSPLPSPTLGGSCSFGNNGALIRSLDPGGNSAPVDPFATVAPGGCPVCHSVSANGSTFVTSDRGWGSGGGVSRINADGTFTLISDSPQPPNPNVDSRGFAYAAITPDGKYVLQGSNLWGNTKYAGATSGSRLSGGNGQGLEGDYFPNKTLTGTATLTEIDQTVGFNWGTGTPDPLLPSGAFSVRWTGKVQPYSTETYTFETETEDGVRLWVNGTLLIDKWTNQNDVKNSGTIALNAGVKYDIKMEYYVSSANALAYLRWSSPTTAYGVIPETQLYPPPQAPTTHGLTGYYYNNQFWTPPATVTRVDSTVNFDWGSGSPDPSIGVDYFTVIWQGSVQAAYTETYTFQTATDDGVALWVNGVQLINDLVYQGANAVCPADSTHSGSIALTAGQKYSIKMQYFENTGGASAKLYWSSPSTPCAIIPNSRLYQ